MEEGSKGYSEEIFLLEPHDRWKDGRYLPKAFSSDALAFTKARVGCTKTGAYRITPYHSNYTLKRTSLLNDLPLAAAEQIAKDKNP